MQIAHGSPPRHVEKCLRRRALRRQATSPGVIANRSGPAAREETNEVGHSWTGSRWSRTRRATGLLKPESALQLRPLLVVRGITIRAEATLSIIALLVMWSFWSDFTTTNSGVTVVATAIASTALFLGSILAHEIERSRSETSRIERSRCHAVRVWSGNRFTSDIKRPGDEFALTIVGSWTSIILGFGFGLGAFGASSTGIGTYAEIAGQLRWLNVILGVFNLLPEVPLADGHLPEATVWRITLNHSRATAKSTRTGQILGALIIVFGLNELVFVNGASSWAGRLAREDLNRDVFAGGQITGMTSSPKVS